MSRINSFFWRVILVLASITPAISLQEHSPPPTPADAPPPAQDAASDPPQDAAPDAAATLQTQPAAETPPPNLRIRTEGNRRWCARTREPVWPATTPPRLPAAAHRMRTPPISTMSYAYYVIAYPESSEEVVSTPPESSSEPAAADAAAAGTDAEAEEATTPDSAVEEPYAPQEWATPEESAAPEEPAAPEESAAPGSGLSPIDPDLAKLPGAVILTQSPVMRTMTPRRVQVRGQPSKVEYFWDAARTCCMFPSQIDAHLPEGKYTIQVHFDVLMRRHGWKHVQVARITGVEIKEGTPTEVPLRVDLQGYAQVNPKNRVVEFPGAAPPPVAGSEASPPASPPPPSQTAPADPTAGR